MSAANNPARPLSGALLARLEDIKDGRAAAFDFVAHEARFSLILARRGDNIFAYENVCPHAGFPLERPDGRVLVQGGKYLICSAHAASFELETGECVGGPCLNEALTPVAVRVADGAVFMA